ncbi:uncharacterized protein [Palaemon carinicauda]|uniref:uncharacterized protein n=1 Tax=Palaemon carinicauda TaxID=392227 RepID=UPI0035B67A24
MISSSHSHTPLSFHSLLPSPLSSPHILPSPLPSLSHPPLLSLSLSPPLFPLLFSPPLSPQSSSHSHTSLSFHSLLPSPPPLSSQSSSLSHTPLLSPLSSLFSSQSSSHSHSPLSFHSHTPLSFPLPIPSSLLSPLISPPPSSLSPPLTLPSSLSPPLTLTLTSPLSHLTIPPLFPFLLFSSQFSSHSHTPLYFHSPPSPHSLSTLLSPLTSTKSENGTNQRKIYLHQTSRTQEMRISHRTEKLWSLFP